MNTVPKRLVKRCVFVKVVHTYNDGSIKEVEVADDITCLDVLKPSVSFLDYVKHVENEISGWKGEVKP